MAKWILKGVGHIGHLEAMEAGCREFEPRPGHYSRMSFCSLTRQLVRFSHPHFKFILNAVLVRKRYITGHLRLSSMR